MTNKYTIEELKEKLSTLKRHAMDYSIETMVVENDGEYIEVEDIEKLFNIKL